MPYIGQIEPVSEAAKIDAYKWMEIIDTHDSLTHVPPVMGINPFTREACEYNAPGSTARIVFRGAGIGSIGWAMDGSPFLMVSANEESVEEEVAKIAENVAKGPGARFVRNNAEN